MNTYFVYIITNEGNRVLYVGISSNLVERIYKHKYKFFNGFSAKYGLNKLIYYETTSDIRAAIEREKRLKKWPREYKINLINKFNPLWEDLYNEIV